MSYNSADDLVLLTGLTPERAQECFAQSRSCFRVALASVVQSSLPTNYFRDTKCLEQNAREINNILRETYDLVRDEIKQSHCDETAAWANCIKNGFGSGPRTPSPSAAAPASPSPSTVKPASPSPTPLKKEATPAPSPFAFKASTPATPPATSTPPTAKSESPSSTTATPGPSPAAPQGEEKKMPPPTPATGLFSFGGNSNNNKSATAPPPKPASAAGDAAKPNLLAGFGQTAKAVTDDSKKPVEKKVFLPKDRYAGCFLDMPTFQKEEVDARCTLLNLDHGFIMSQGKDKLRQRMLKWHEAAGTFHIATPLEYVKLTNPDDEVGRVIIKDAVRTFFADVHREKFSEFLYAVYREFGNYGQSMSYLAGICLLALTEQETVGILRKMNKEVIAGHWAAEASGFATNAWLIESMMKKRCPEVTAHFEKMNFWPDTYMQKILSGLTVHVLPFEQVFEFLDEVMQQGFPWLVKYMIAIVEHFTDRLLSIKDDTKINDMFGIMRLDMTCVDVTDTYAIMARAKKMDVTELIQDYEVLRMEIYNKKILPRLNKAPKEPTFEPCEICEKARPTFFCDECGCICEGCHKGNKGSHTAEHEVDDY